MPTKLPRMYITLTPELMKALDEFNAETGLARSQLVSQLLSETVPVIHAMTEAYRMAKKSPAAAVDRMRELTLSTHINLAQSSLQLEEARPRKLRRSPRKMTK